MIKINNNIILEIDGMFFNTLETNINRINNNHKKKYKNVTKTILKLQDIYGVELDVNYILNEIEIKKNPDNEITGENITAQNTKKIVINKKFIGGSG